MAGGGKGGVEGGVEGGVKGSGEEEGMGECDKHHQVRLFERNFKNKQINFEGLPYAKQWLARQSIERFIEEVNSQDQEVSLSVYGLFSSALQGVWTEAAFHRCQCCYAALFVPLCRTDIFAA